MNLVDLVGPLGAPGAVLFFLLWMRERSAHGKTNEALIREIRLGVQRAATPFRGVPDSLPPPADWEDNSVVKVLRPQVEKEELEKLRAVEAEARSYLQDMKSDPPLDPDKTPKEPVGRKPFPSRY